MDRKLKMLCELYDRSDENINVSALLKVCFLKNLLEVLHLLSHKQCVKFAYLCAKSIFHLIDNKKIRNRAEFCFTLTERWLENPNSVSDDELISASYNSAYDNIEEFNDFDAAYIASYAAAYVSYSASYIIEKHEYVVVAVENVIGSTISAVENKQEQEYKNLGFLVKVIRDG